MKKLVISTGNVKKLKEIEKILGDFNLDVISKKDAGYGDLEVIEDGETLYDNSYLKAKALHEKLNCMVLADDSGLFVDALDGQPGVYSARYAGEDGNDLKNNEKLLAELKDVKEEDRTARFKTTIVVITEDGQVIHVEGVCEGKIIESPRGMEGFGYDPLFIPEGYTKTFAELGGEIKNKISHRGKALAALEGELKKRLK